MTKVSHHVPTINGRDTPIALPLLEYGERARIKALPTAAKRLAQRFGLPPSTSCVVARAAGFNIETPL